MEIECLVCSTPCSALSLRILLLSHGSGELNWTSVPFRYSPVHEDESERLPPLFLSEERGDDPIPRPGMTPLGLRAAARLSARDQCSLTEEQGTKPKVKLEIRCFERYEEVHMATTRNHDRLFLFPIGVAFSPS